jgi:hypothetical protein
VCAFRLRPLRRRPQHPQGRTRPPPDAARSKTTVRPKTQQKRHKAAEGHLKSGSLLKHPGTAKQLLKLFETFGTFLKTVWQLFKQLFQTFETILKQFPNSLNICPNVLDIWNNFKQFPNSLKTLKQFKICLNNCFKRLKRLKHFSAIPKPCKTV